jgi:hypothetical protein
METPALLSEDYGAWVAIEQPYADPRLQPRDGPADAGRSQAECVGCPNEAAGFDHGYHHTDTGEQPRIEH